MCNLDADANPNAYGAGNANDNANADANINGNAHGSANGTANGHSRLTCGNAMWDLDAIHHNVIFPVTCGSLMLMLTLMVLAMLMAMLTLMPIAMVMLMVRALPIHPVTRGNANGNGYAHDTGDGMPFTP